MTFRVGQKVVCVNADRWPLWAKNSCVLPVHGRVYTVRDIWSFSKGPVIYLDEIKNPACCVNDDSGALIEPGFPALRFRPVVERKTDISIFTSMLNPSKVDA